ncbi:hypothetical protein GCM10027027_16850 [Neomicrococcus lactis]
MTIDFIVPRRHLPYLDGIIGNTMQLLESIDFRSKRGVFNVDGPAHFGRCSPMARNVTRRVGGFLAAVARAAAAFGSTANAAERNIDYVNLGDSYSAGYGTGSLTIVGDACSQGTGSDHVSKLAAKKNVNLTLDFACAGADSATLAGIAATVAAGALGDAEVVTLTVGGNELPWAELPGACAYGDDLQCAGAQQVAGSILSSLYARVLHTLSVIRSSAPNARIVILGSTTIQTIHTTFTQPPRAT